MYVVPKLTQELVLSRFKEIHNDVYDYSKVKYNHHQQKRDKIKKQHCIDNNINLLIIKYTEHDKIDEILKQQLSFY